MTAAQPVPVGLATIFAGAGGQFAVELRRLRHDRVGILSLPLTIVSAVAVASSVPHDIRSAPLAVRSAVAEEFGDALLDNLLIFAAVVAGLRIAIAMQTGVLPRDMLFARRLPVLVAHGVSTVVVNIIFTAIGLVVIVVSLLTVTGENGLRADSIVRALGAAVAVSLWGFCLGASVRNPIIVLFVVPASLMPSGLLGSIIPTSASVAPYDSFTALVGHSSTALSSVGALWASVGWLAAAVTLTGVLMSRRDVL